MKRLLRIVLFCVACVAPADIFAQPEPMNHMDVGEHTFAYHIVGEGDGTPLSSDT